MRARKRIKKIKIDLLEITEIIVQSGCVKHPVYILKYRKIIGKLQSIVIMAKFRRDFNETNVSVSLNVDGGPREQRPERQLGGFERYKKSGGKCGKSRASRSQEKRLQGGLEE